MHRRRFITSALAATGASLIARPARAESYPVASRTIRLVVPFAPGGGVDVLARLYAEALKDAHGLTVVVENRGGANGSLGGQMVHQAAPDGYTLLFSASTHTMARLVMRNAPYDPLTEFTPIARVGEAPMLVIMSADRPQKTIAEVIADAKKDAGALDLRRLLARLDGISGDRGVQPECRAQPHHHVLSRHRAGAHRRGGRPCAADDRSAAGAAAAGARRRRSRRWRSRRPSAARSRPTSRPRPRAA